MNSFSLRTFHILLAVASIVKAQPSPAPDAGETAQQLCANFTLNPEYLPYLNTSFIGPQRSVQVGTVDYAYRTFGPLSGTGSAGSVGTPLVLINGAGHTMTDWSPCFLRTIAGNREVVIFDNRGLGMSNDSYTGNYTLNDFASSIVDLTKALNMTRPNILGLSTGSLYAQTIAANYGSEVSSVILSGTILTGAGINAVQNPASPSQVFQPAQGIQQTVPSRSYPYYTPAGMAGLCNNLNMTSYMPVDKPSPAQSMHQATVGYDVEGPGGNEVYSRLPNITNPVLIIAGTQDVVLSVEYDIEATNIIPGASLLQWADAGHYALFQYCLDNANIINLWLNAQARQS